MRIAGRIVWYVIGVACWVAGGVVSARDPVAGSVLFVTGVLVLPYTGVLLDSVLGLTYYSRGRQLILCLGTIVCGIVGLIEEQVRHPGHAQEALHAAARRSDSLAAVAEAMLARGSLDSAHIAVAAATAMEHDTLSRAAVLLAEIARYRRECAQHAMLLGLSDQQFADLQAGRVQYRPLTNRELNALLVRNMFENRSLRSEVAALEQARRDKTQREELARRETAARARQAALSRMRARVDDMEGVTWYYDRTTAREAGQDAFYLYFAVKPGQAPHLRWRIQCAACNGLAVQSFFVKADSARYDRPDAQFEPGTGTARGERFDQPVTSRELDFLRRIAASTSAAVRFQGTQYYRDRTLSQTEKAALRRVIEAFEAAGGSI